GGALWVVLASREKSVPGAAGILVDRFTQDSSLNPGIWLANGPVGAVAGSKLTLPASEPVPPAITFSATTGLGLAGAGANLQAATLQSAATVAPPFSVTAEAMMPA